MTRTKLFDPLKPVETRDGREVRILTTNADLGSGETIVAIVDDEVRTYFPTGSYLGPGYESDDADLVNPLDRQVVYLNLGNAYTNKDAAIRATENRWDILEVHLDGGDGDQDQPAPRVVRTNLVAR